MTGLPERLLALGIEHGWTPGTVGRFRFGAEAIAAVQLRRPDVSLAMTFHTDGTLRHASIAARPFPVDLETRIENGVEVLVGMRLLDDPEHTIVALDWPVPL